MVKENKSKSLPESIRTILDGRPNRWLADKSGVHESEISRILKGRLIPTQKQLDKINTALSTNFTINK